jgi:polyhydroxyalkanoate synthesis regulator phasin
MRVIKLKLMTQNSLVAVETDALTLGEFKQVDAVRALEIDWSNAKLIDRASKASFDLDESRLPEVDSIMFVTPVKTKAGMLPYSEAKAQVKELIAEGKIESINWMGKTTEDLNRIIYDYDVAKGNFKVIDSTTMVQEIQDLLNQVSEKVTKLASMSGSDSSVLTKELIAFKENLADFVTKDSLDIEAEELALRFEN